MNDIINYLLPFSISIFVFVIGVILFKNFLKIIVIVSLIIGGIAFYSQDAFALGLSDFLPSKIDKKSEKISKKSKFRISQSEDGTVSVYKKKTYRFMQIGPDNEVVLFDNVMRYDLGIIESDEIIKKMMKELFNDPKQYKIDEDEGDEE